MILLEQAQLWFRMTPLADSFTTLLLGAGFSNRYFLEDMNCELQKMEGVDAMQFSMLQKKNPGTNRKCHQFPFPNKL